MSTREWLDSLTKEQLRAWLRIGGVTFKICMGLLKENNFNVGKDGNLYVDYCCNGDYSKLSEVDPKTFNKHRAEAYKNWQEENEDE